MVIPSCSSSKTRRNYKIMCVDYSKLTDKTIKDTYPLPRIDDTFSYLAGAKYYTIVDAASGFWQIPVHENDQEKLAFCTTFGAYHWKVMPFGFTNAPSIFQRAMNETLNGELFKCCLVYIDDIIIYSKSFDQHIDDCDRVFALIKKFNWKLKFKKSRFAQIKIEFLGHVITDSKVTVFDKNIQKIKNMKRPKNIKETQQFLGMINYYRRFIQGLSYITEPLLINLRNKGEYIWGKDQEESFIEIISKLCLNPILRLPDDSKQYILKTDASAIGFGGALVQIHKKLEHPVSFFSGTFLPNQRKAWNHWQREAFAVINGIKRYHHHLINQKFKVVTDNESLLTLIKPKTNLTNHMIDRWRLF